MEMRILTFLRNLRLLPVRRHLRRLRARWRLHQIEWYGRMRPLDPPKGYEKYYELEAVFPALKTQPPPAKNFAEFRKRMHIAWRLYKHYYFPDPELAKLELEIQHREDRELEKDADEMLKKAKARASGFKFEAERTIDNFVDKAEAGFEANRPEAEQLVKNRAEILVAAMNEFAAGYNEAVAGKIKLFKIDQMDEFEIPEPDNLPVRYEAQLTDELDGSPKETSVKSKMN